MLYNNVKDHYRDILKDVYLNPYDSVPDIASRNYTSESTVNMVFTKAWGSASRKDWLLSSGYITIPTEVLQYEYKPVTNIMRAFQASPFAGIEEISAYTGYSVATIGQAVLKTYRYFNFNNSAVRCPRQFQRIAFYEFLGWFGRNRLAKDAMEQY